MLLAVSMQACLMCVLLHLLTFSNVGIFLLFLPEIIDKLTRTFIQEALFYYEPHSHLDECIGSTSGFSILPWDMWTCGPEEPGIKPPTFQLDDLLSQSCSQNTAKLLDLQEIMNSINNKIFMARTLTWTELKNSGLLLVSDVIKCYRKPTFYCFTSSMLYCTHPLHNQVFTPFFINKHFITAAMLSKVICMFQTLWLSISTGGQWSSHNVFHLFLQVIDRLHNYWL